MTKTGLEITVQDIDHCGIIAGICDEMKLVEQVDKLLGNHSQEIISSGQVVKAMILNGLGFLSAPLYLFEKFFVGKATEHLLGEGIRPEHLNDDRLGRVLDKLYKHGLTEVFVTIFGKLITEFKQQWEIDTLFVADAALYTEENLEQMKELRWVSRVPATLKEAQQLLDNIDKNEMVSSRLPGYRITPFFSSYGGIQQRWLLVESHQRQESDLKQLEKRIAKQLGTSK